MEQKKGPIKVPVHDKRRSSVASAPDSPAGPQRAPVDPASPPGGIGEMSDTRSKRGTADSVSDISLASPEAEAESEAHAADKDYKDLYLRAVADLENERKRFKVRESERAERSVRALIESLLPVLDNFERAIAHGEGGEGVALVFKQLAAVLETEGVVEIPAEGAEFDPNLHEAVESRVQPGLEIPTVIEVHRRGYLLNGQLLRAALVVVGRPEEPEEARE